MAEKFIAPQANLASSHELLLKRTRGQWPPGRLNVVHCFQKLGKSHKYEPRRDHLDNERIYECCTKQEYSITLPERLEHRRNDHSRNSAKANIYHYLRQK